MSQGLTTGLQMVTGIVLARLLMPKDFGILGMATMVTGLAGIFRDLGLGQALVQRKSIEKVHLTSAYWGTMVMGILLTGLTLLLAPYVGGFFREPRMVPVLRAVSFTFLASPFATVPNAMLQRALDFRRPFHAGVASSVTYAAVGVTMALHGYGYWSLVWALLASTVVGTVAICVATRHLPPMVPCFRGIRDLYSFGIGQTGVGLLDYVVTQIDYFIIGRRLTAEALGLYTRAYQLVTYPGQFASTGVYPVLFPAFAQLQDQKPRARKAFGHVLTTLTTLSFPILALLGVSAPELIPALFGPQWHEAALPVQIMTVVGAVRTIGSPVGAVAKAMGRIHTQVWMEAVRVALIGTGAWFGTRWGIGGVAWGVLLAHLVTLPFSAVLMCSIGFSASDWTKALRAPLVSAAFICLVTESVRALSRHLDLGPSAVLAATLVSGLVAAMIATSFSPFDEGQLAWLEFRSIVRRLRPH